MAGGRQLFQLRSRLAGLFKRERAPPEQGANLDEAGAALEQQPDQAVAHYKRGNLLEGREEFEAALADYDRAIALNPRYAYALCNAHASSIDALWAGVPMLTRIGRSSAGLWQ